MAGALIEKNQRIRASQSEILNREFTGNIKNYLNKVKNVYISLFYLHLSQVLEIITKALDL